MVGVAAGMSTMGLRAVRVQPLPCSPRAAAFEQIRNSIGYPHLNVKIAATHAGLSVGEDGASHQCCEDFALMRSIPGMVVLSPADDVEARAAVIAAYDYNGPVYLRFGRLATPVFHDPATYQFQIGKGEKLTGRLRHRGHRHRPDGPRGTARRQCWPSARASPSGSSTCPPSSPWTRTSSSPPPSECRRIITVEEHSIIGGLGEAVCCCRGRKAARPRAPHRRHGPVRSLRPRRRSPA